MCQTVRRLTTDVKELALSPSVIDLIRTRVDLSWCLEEAHYAYCPTDDHPFRVLLALDRWLCGTIDADSVHVPSLDTPVPQGDGGRCPLCGNRDAVRTLGSQLWAICETHETCWLISGGGFSCDELFEEPSPTWFNWGELCGYRVVPPSPLTTSAEAA